jgi:hypothetical protein
VHTQVVSQLKGAKLELKELKAPSLLLGACTSCPMLKSDLEACSIEIKDVALVDQIKYNPLSISQLVDADLDVLFYKSGSQVLDSSDKLICGISRLEKVFQADFSFAQSSVKCLIPYSLSELWKWHRRLGHLRFDLLYRLSGLGLLRGLPCSSLRVT